MQTYAKPKDAPSRKTAIQRLTTASEWPFRVASYQFKSLEDARKFSRDLADSPKSGHRHSVGMFHRRVEMEIFNGTDRVLAPILLDVTVDSPDEAEAKYNP